MNRRGGEYVSKAEVAKLLAAIVGEHEANIKSALARVRWSDPTKSYPRVDEVGAWAQARWPKHATAIAAALPACNINAVVLQAPDVRPGTVPTLCDLLTRGTSSEARGALRDIGVLLRHGRPLSRDVARTLGEMLERIGNGVAPAKALGLTRKTKHGVTERLALDAMVADLRAQGLSAEEARSLVARLNTGELYEPEPKAPLLRPDSGEAGSARIRKRGQRAGTK